MKISIITVVRNGEATIEDCLKSVGSQSYPVEHIIVDGASTDGTLDIVEKYQVNGNGGCKVVSEPDNGIYDAMNKGIGIATGDVIGILNADDFYASPDVLERVAEVFIRSGVDSCYGDLVYVRNKAGGDGRGAMGELLNGVAKMADSARDSTQNSKFKIQNFQVFRYWKSGLFRRKNFYWGWMPPHPTFFVRREVYGEYGAFNTSLGSAADYELMLRFLLKHQISCAYIPEVLVCMRQGGASNASLRNRIKANLMDRKAWRVNGLQPYPWTLWMKPVRKVGQFFLSFEF